MIGFYNYTVWLTYLSAISAVVGIVVSLSGTGRVDVGLMCLLICGLCDAFDGQVARTKKNRTDSEKAFGIQIDSLSDLIAFGVLPVCIGAALYRQALAWADDATGGTMLLQHIPLAVLIVIDAIYVLAALIRLAYYNVTEEERQKVETGKRKYYTGLPVTSAALIFPTFLLVQRLTATDLSAVYYLLLLLTAAAFLLRFQLKKPPMKAILALVGVGAVEFVIFLIKHILAYYG